MRKGIFRNLWLAYDTNYKVDMTAKLKGLYDGTMTTILPGLTATEAEINLAADLSVQAAMVAGAGITEGTDTVVKHAVLRQGDFYVTKIYLDIDGLSASAVDLDVIGDTGGEGAWYGKIAAATNGAIMAGQVTCLETPAGAGDMIDFWSADDQGKEYDDPSSGFTNGVNLLTHAGWTAGASAAMAGFPGDADYLYMLIGDGGENGEYTAGKFLIEMWGI